MKAIFNEPAVDEYLGNRYVRAPYTFFQNIYQLKAGFYSEINSSLIAKEHKYWDIPAHFNTAEDFDEDKLARSFEQELIKSINYRLISDVPLGTYLSGGVDSSLITAITAKSKKEILNTYTIGFSDLNEFEYSRIIALQYNTSHHEILMKKEDYIDNWERLIGFKDAPLGVPNEIPLAVMSSKLKEKITVVLSGEGADELMGGYGRIFRTPFDFENEENNLSFYDYFINDYEYVSRGMRDKFIVTSKEYREEFDDRIKSEFSNKTNEENVFRFFHKYHVKGLLQRVDMTTMQTSVEARVPFLDHKLIEFAYTKIPYNLKLKWKSDKAKKQAIKVSSNKYSENLDTPKYLLKARQEYADLIHGLNEKNQNDIDNYNANLAKELSSYGKHYDSIVASINDERLYQGRTDLLFYDIGKIYNQNKLEFNALSSKLSDSVNVNVKNQDETMGRQLGQQVNLQEKYTLTDDEYRNVKLDLQSKGIK